MMETILYVEDDLSLIDGLEYTMETNGYSLDNARTVKQAIRIIDEMREATHGEYPRFALFENVPYVLQRIRDVMNRKQL